MHADTLRTVRRLAAAAVASAVLAAASPASAGDSAGTIGVELNVSSACLVNGATSAAADLGQTGKIQFPDQPGQFDDVDGELVGSLGALSIRCSPGAAPSLTIGSGAHDAGGVRRMASNGSTVSYRLFTNASRSDEITIGRQLALPTATAAAITVPIYARTSTGGQLLAPGKYTDTVQVTLSW